MDHIQSLDLLEVAVLGTPMKPTVPKKVQAKRAWYAEYHLGLFEGLQSTW
jgi:hypothetical protein